jgi:hypothetical protein
MSDSTKKIYTYDEKLAQNTLLAELITKSYKLDLDCLEQQYRELDTQLTVMPIMDPTAWRDNHKSIEATMAVLKAGIDFSKVARAVRNPEGDYPQ